jgi:hypothetical protein
MWMGWHLKWVDVSTRLASVQHWRLRGVDPLKIKYNLVEK